MNSVLEGPASDSTWLALQSASGHRAQGQTLRLVHDLQEVVGRDELRAARPVEEAVYIR